MDHGVQNFQEDVIAASHKQPVLVDFWAAWCGPCRVLGPILEKLEREQSGAWKLVKVNTDENPEISRSFRIQGIPAVKLFIDGTIVDEFTGALPEHAVKQWLEKAIPTENRQRLVEAERQLSDGNTEAAVSLLEAVLQDEPNNPTASGLLAGIVAFTDPDRASALAAATGEHRFAQTVNAIRQLEEMRARLSTSETIPEEAGKEDYLKAIEALKAGDLDETLRLFIEVIKKNRFLDDDAARKSCVAIFTLLGEAHPISRKYRRTFDMWLY